MKRLVILLAASALAVATPACGGGEPAAAGPSAVTVTLELQLGGNVHGVFTAEGNAVDEELICPSGSVVESDLAEVGPGHETWQLHYMCDDDSGTLTMQVDSHHDSLDGQDLVASATWTLSGEGSYDGVTGEGGGSITCTSTTCRDEYAGEISGQGEQ